MSLKSSSQDDSLLAAIAIIQKHRSSHKELLPLKEDELPELALDWISDKWRKLVFERTGPEEPMRINRKYFELAVLSEVMDELKSGDLYVEHSGDYDDYRNHLVSWEEYEQDVGTYGEMLGMPVETQAFIDQLRSKLSTLASDVDKHFPENEHADIDHTGIIIRKTERPKPPPELEAVDRVLTTQMNQASILDVLTETEKWLDLHKLFGPLSGFEAKVDDGIIAENVRHEQRKVIKYNQLVANMVILHNVHEMTRLLKEIQSKGYELTEEVLRGLPWMRTRV